FDNDFTERRKRERSCRADGRFDERADWSAHLARLQRETRARSPATSASMIPAWITETITDGTPASRCIADAPDSSAPKTIPVPMTAKGFNRASRATAIAVKPYPGEIFSYSAYVTPETSIAPARPASAPLTRK